MPWLRSEHRLLLLWAVLAAVLVSLPIPILLRQSILVDDAFYALAAARHLAAGDGSTVDGLHATDGYQPLWVWTLAGLTRALRLGAGGTVRAALVLCALATGVAGLLAARLARDVGGSDRAAAWAAGLWLLNPYLVKRQFNGLESGLAALLLLACARAAIRQTSRREEFKSGALAGFAALARIDLLVLAPLLALRRRWLAAAAAGAIAAPWLLWGRVRFGSWVPMSGEATQVWYAVTCGLDPRQPPPFDPGQASLALAWLLGLGWPAAGLERAGLPREWVWLVAPAALAAVAWIASRGGGLRARARSLLDSAHPLVFWTAAPAAFLFLAYGWLFPAPWHLNRYFLPMHALGAVWLGLGAEALVGGQRGRECLWAAACAAAFLAGLVPWAIDTSGGRSPALQLEVARWIRERVPGEARVGALQSGVIGYYAGRPIANLDGKVNPGAMRALQDGTMGTYLKEERIDLFGDWEDLVERVFDRAGDLAATGKAAPLPVGEGPPGPFRFYRLRSIPPPRAASQGPTGPRAW